MAEPAEGMADSTRLFREANEKIRALSSDYGDPVNPIPFLCECRQENCTTIVRMSPEEYSAIRAHSRRYFTAAGHEANEAPDGRVLARSVDYVVVEEAT